jgi:MarR family transcriptional regulator, organic hydroperoxide resistance regulator
VSVVESSLGSPTIGYALWRLATNWRTAVDRAVAPLGLTHAQYSLVASLLGMHRVGERPSQRQLADHTGLDPIYVSKLIRALERSGAVERAVDPADSRAVRLALTAEGRHTAERAVAVVAELHEMLLAPLGGARSRRATALKRDLDELLAVPIPAPTPTTGNGDAT